MISMLETDNQYGVITCKVIEQPSKKLLCAGLVRRSNNQLSYYGYGEEPDKPEYSYVRSVDAGFPHFYLIRRKTLDEVLASSQRIQETAWYFRSIQEKGYEIQYQPKSTVMWNPSNAPKLDVDQSPYIPDPLQDQSAVEYVPSRPNILVIDDYIPAIRYGSGFARLYEMLLCLAELGFSVTFFPVGNPVKVQPETEKLQQKGIEVFWDHFADLYRFAKERSGYYDIVLISRPHVFEAFFPKIQQYFPNAAILYDAEAIFYTREVLKAKIKGIQTDDAEKSRMASAEMRLIEMADLVISVSQRDKEIMKQASSQENIEVWGHIQDVSMSSTPFEQRRNILFLGSFFAGPGSPNEDAALFFANEIFPRIRKKLDCTLYVVGGSPTPAIEDLACDEIKVTGYVEDLEQYFNSCKVNVVPTRFAAGIPLKLLQAMGSGLPSVVTPIIADQLNLSNTRHVLVAETPDEFAEKVVRLYSEQDLWNTIHRNSFEYIQNNFSREIMREKLANLISQGLNLKEIKFRDYANNVTDLHAQPKERRTS
jgi:glycosyltransferase involved in cell wall biosynthesis